MSICTVSNTPTILLLIMFSFMYILLIDMAFAVATATQLPFHIDTAQQLEQAGAPAAHHVNVRHRANM